MKITFLGDLSATGNFYSGVLHENLLIDSKLIKIFKSSDYTIVNLEGSVTTNECIYDKHIKVQSPVNTIAYFNKIGINVYNLANNHIFDAGIEGFIDTRSNILKNNCYYFGAGENIKEASNIRFFEKNGIKIGLIGIGSPGSSGKDCINSNEGIISDMNISLIEQLIINSRKNADWTIINFHNGTEFNFYPVTYVQDKLKRFIDMGADIIIGHHPHVPQGIKKYKEGIIFYSLGNFLFDLKHHSKHKYSNLSVVPTFEFSKKDFKYEYILTEYNINEVNVIINNDKKIKKWYKNLNNRTNSKLSSTYSFFDLIRTIYFNPIFFKKKILNYLIPFTIFLKPYSFRKGNAREMLRDILSYLKIGFLFKLIKGRNTLSKDEEY